MQAITEKLEQGIRDLFESDKFKTYLATMAKFHNYSFNNVILICMQKPDATLVAGYNAWKEKFGRQVTKGQKGIRILAPCPYKKRVNAPELDGQTHQLILDPTGKPVMKEKEITIPMFRPVSVFDISQTEGKELPQLGPDELTGDVKDYGILLAALQKISPVKVEMKDIQGGAKGYFDLTENKIAIKTGMSEVQTIKTLIHEIAHATLHTEDKAKALKAEGMNLTRNEKEVQAEAVAYCVSTFYSRQYEGLDVSDYSFSYIAGWSTGKELPELKESLKIIGETANSLIEAIDQSREELVKEQKDEAKTAVAEAGLVYTVAKSVIQELKDMKTETKQKNAKLPARKDKEL